MNLMVNLALPKKTREALLAVLEEALGQEKDKAKRAQAERLFKALSPTLKTGEFDLAFDMRGPSQGGRYSLVAGQKITDGPAVEKALRDAIRDLPEAERNKVRLDAEKAGDVAIHRLEVKDADADFKKTFGEGPAYVAVRSDAAFLALGENALGVLKEALTVQPKVGKPAQFEMAVSRLAETMAKEQPKAPKAAREAFGKGKGDDKLWFALEAGKELRLRFAMKAQVLRFFHLLEPGAAEKGGAEDK